MPQRDGNTQLRLDGKTVSIYLGNGTYETTLTVNSERRKTPKKHYDVGKSEIIQLKTRALAPVQSKRMQSNVRPTIEATFRCVIVSCPFAEVFPRKLRRSHKEVSMHYFSGFKRPNYS